MPQTQISNLYIIAIYIIRRILITQATNHNAAKKLSSSQVIYVPDFIYNGCDPKIS